MYSTAPPGEPNTYSTPSSFKQRTRISAPVSSTQAPLRRKNPRKRVSEKPIYSNWCTVLKLPSQVKRAAEPAPAGVTSILGEMNSQLIIGDAPAALGGDLDHEALQQPPQAIIGISRCAGIGGGHHEIQRRGRGRVELDRNVFEVRDGCFILAQALFDALAKSLLHHRQRLGLMAIIDAELDRYAETLARQVLRMTVEKGGDRITAQCPTDPELHQFRGLLHHATVGAIGQQHHIVFPGGKPVFLLVLGAGQQGIEFIERQAQLT